MPNQQHFRTGLITFSIPILLVSLSTSIVNISIPTLVSSFQQSLNGVQWVIVVYLISMMSSSVIIGQYLDQHDRRQILMGGIVLFMLSALCCALAPSIGWLIFYRALQGIATAMMLSSAMLLFISYQADPNSAQAMGWIGSLSAVGTALGPTLGGALIGFAGWPAIFWINIPIGIAALILIFRLPHSTTSPASPQVVPPKKTVDWLAMLLLSLSLITYGLGFSLDRPLNIIFLICSALCGYGFYRMQRRSLQPMIPLNLLSRGPVSAGLLINSLMATAMMATLIVGPFYLSLVLQFPPAKMGLVMSVGPLLAASLGVPAARWVDHFGVKTIRTFALSCSALGFSLFALLAQQLTLWSYILLMVFVTIGYALFQTANNTALILMLEPKRKGLMTGLLNLSRNIGLINGTVLMSSIFAYSTGRQNLASFSESSTASVIHGFSWCFSITALLMGISLLISLKLKSDPPSQQTSSI